MGAISSRMGLPSGREVLLLCAVLGFGQAFFYIQDFPLLYRLAKAVLPALALLVGIAILLGHLRWGVSYPYAVVLLLAAAGLSLQSALRSAVCFGQPVYWGLWAQIKLLPVAFYGIVLYGLRRFSISLEEVARAVSAVGVMTLLVGGFLKFFANPEWFSTSGAGEGGRLLLYDPIRGYRYNLYLPLVALSTLYWAHRWWTAGGGRYALGVVGGIGTVAFVVQSRSMLFGLLFGLILAGWRYPKWRRLVLMSLPPVVVLLGGVVVYFEPLELLSALALRSSTAERVLFELGSDPIRWLFGMGYVNPLWGYTLQDFYGVNFWTSDVGWLGIAFELGLIGVIAIALFYVLLGRALYRMPEESDASFVRALQDFFWVTVLLSPLVPAVPLHTGLYASLLALAMHAGGGLPCRRPLSGTS
jgi:hypothetical protein